jgi:hypothetical protein
MRARTPLLKLEPFAKEALAHDGFPVLRVSDNVVISPMGPALQAFVRGQVSIEDNQLTSQGVESGRGESPATGILGALAVLGGTTVRIFNAGISSEAAEIFTGFQNMTGSQPTPAGNLTVQPFAKSAALAALIGGNVLFNDNQILLAPRGRDDRPIVSSVLIISADDISMHGNQADSRAIEQPLFTNGLILGWSVRVADNRFKEHIDIRGLSAFTFGIMNSTTDNQGTRCFVVLGFATLKVDAPNRSLFDWTAKDFCARAQKVFTANLAGTAFV